MPGDAAIDDATVASEGAPSRLRLDVQGLRAVAVVVVVVFHTGAALSGGFVGVDVFFVISGFVIFGALDAEHTREGAIRVGAFYLRRIRRLLPALALLLVTVALLWPWFGGRNDLDTARMVTGGALIGANVQLLRLDQGYFDPAAEHNPLLHLWTLSLEEQVYLSLPLVVLAVGAVARRRGWPWRRSVVVTLAVGALGSFALALLLSGAVTGRFGRVAAEAAFYLAPTRVWEFLAGALLALGGAWVSRLGRGAREAAGAAGALLLGWAVVTFDGSTAFPHVAAVVPVVAAVLLIVAGTGSASAVSGVLATGPMRWIGDRSYSWYLWHWPVIVAAGSTFPGTSWAPVVAGALSIVPAAVAYRLVEDPIRRRTAMGARPTLVLGVACAVVPLVLAQTVVPVGHRLDEDPGLQELRYAARPHLDQVERCNASLSGANGADECTWPAPGSTTGRRALLLGDSNAGHLSEAFVAAAHAEGMAATIQTRAACPVADLFIRRNGFVDDACRAFLDRQVRWVLAERPAVVVVAHAGNLLMDKAEVELAAERGGPFASDDRSQGRLWAEGLTATLGRFVDAGVPVVLVATVPHLTGWPGLGGCARARALLDLSGCGAARTPRTRVVDRAQETALAALPEVHGLDLTPLLCPDGTCRTRHDGIWWWKDESHLSVDANARLVEPLRAALAATASGGKTEG